jgi:hypothetical protein
MEATVNNFVSGKGCDHLLLVMLGHLNAYMFLHLSPNPPILNIVASSWIRPGVTSNQAMANNHAGYKIMTVDTKP